MKGMTSYSQADKKEAGFNLEVAIRSTNAKYLEIIIHQLPPEKIFLEEKIKKEIKKKIKRGRIEVFFFLKLQPKQKLVVNDEMIGQYYKQVKMISKRLKIPNEILPNQLLLMPGVMRIEEDTRIDNNAIVSVFLKAINKLILFKKKEGNVISQEMSKNMKLIKTNIVKIKESKKIKNPGDESNKDIAEEISLILFYVSKLKKIVSTKKDEFKGKAIDFLTQEILRELNAAASKTKTKNISWQILEAKSFLERIREQAQNIE